MCEWDLELMGKSWFSEMKENFLNSSSALFFAKAELATYKIGPNLLLPSTTY